jgi:hypothetical protein
MHLIACSTRLIVVSSMFFSMDSSYLVESDCEEKCIGLINDVQFITHIHIVKCAFELQNRWSYSQSWWCASFQCSFKCIHTITSVRSHSHVSEGNSRWRYEVVPQVQRCFQLLLEFTRSWNVFEQYCPRCDLNVLVHWLSFFEPHCALFIDSSLNHLSLPPSWAEYCLFSFSESTVLPQGVSTFQGVLRRVDVISC